MAADEDTADDGRTLDGERGITSIAASTGKTGNVEISKKVGIAAGIVFLGLLAWLQWPASEEQAAEEVTESTRRIRAGSAFQPADIGESQPEAAPAATAREVADQPVGPIEQIRLEQNQHTAEPSEAELLFESSKRAPLMAFEGSAQADPATGTEMSAEESLFGPPDGGPGQGRTGLAGDLQTTRISGSMASVLENPHLTITQGTLIPCALDTAMDSSQPGMVRCTVTNDVYSTMGTVVLLEKGSRIVGQYRGGLQRGTKRLFVIWTRAETPNGVIVTLDSAGTDALGRGGFDGDVDTQFWTRFGGTMLLSVIDDALAAAVVSSSNADKLENTSNAASDVASVALQSSIDVPIVLRKNQGESVAVMVSRDLDFSSVYRLKPR
ncbi:type IV secretion system protein VirB10 [Sedimentitalea todarodis]|uniref:Type IV secretion system protein VirB10 n=1 Tax=Sedimentitalea todarodis TaxID=1631240 RepID=A0ABU3VF01_9RHOB|nr:type IV secretion system protein VirB10 [Sedimentitalea todarodis]MDU9004744.1 type IV secretion system protein VirB10 [Sedimentitalea todarodis]